MNALFVSVGNLYRHDDGAAPALAARLRAQAIPGLTIIEASDDLIRLVELWTGYDMVVVCDAVCVGLAPGTLYRRNPIACPLPRHWFGVSSHQLGLPEAIELGRAMKRLPSRMLFLGIEGRDFTAGEGLTPEVERALGPAADIVRAEIAATVPAHA
jgi:hydrogenase maturation protease